MMLDPQSTLRAFQILALVFFMCALLHTFFCSSIRALASQKNKVSFSYKILHLLGEVELVFAFWGFLLLIGMSVLQGHLAMQSFLSGLSFNEPLFVFVVMMISATAPILGLTEKLITLIPIAPYFLILGIVPLLGSLITEPAAMTVAALLLGERYFGQSVSHSFRYLSLAILFVNISIGGTLSHFAAPPILMVAKSWDWNTPFLFFHLGWKSIIACWINAGLGMFVLRKELKKCDQKKLQIQKTKLWISMIHLLFLALSVIYLHHPVILIGLVLFFIGFVQSTKPNQTQLRIKDSALVGLFLAGLVVIGAPQEWWLAPLLSSRSPLEMGLGSLVLTSITDNAALTYLGTLIPTLSDAHKLALVTGAVAGGGLTIIANAPNPAGFQILGPYFKNRSIHPIQLLIYALPPTLIAWICLWSLPTIRF